MQDLHTRKSKIIMEPGSFQEAESRVFYYDNRVFRMLGETTFAAWQQVSQKAFFTDLVATGKIVPTRQAHMPQFADSEIMSQAVAVLEHQKIPFISYPYEWSFSMLKDAALLNLELLLSALAEDIILKDASAFNIQWQGCNPIFIDVTSFETLPPKGLWEGYRQFCQMFLYPLMLQAYKNVSFQPWLRGCKEGITADAMKNILSFSDGLRPGVFSHVVLQAKLQAQPSDGSLDIIQLPKEALQNNVRQMQKLIRALHWKQSRSTWSDYDTTHSYSAESQLIKTAFVKHVLEKKPVGLVWDLGCNTGVFSRLAAAHADYVVAMDGDHLSVDKLYRDLKTHPTNNILPLLVDLSDPSPSIGWQGLERQSLFTRSQPDLIMCLALIHHLVIQNNIPLSEVIQWLSKFKARLVIEFVDRTDPMVQVLLKNKRKLYSDYTQENFERCLSQFFTLVEKMPLQDDMRTLYYAEPKTGE